MLNYSAADRIRTIIDYDRILVLGEGQVLEYDTPWALLERPDSAFRELCRQSGDFEWLKQAAEVARETSGRK